MNTKDIVRLDWYPTLFKFKGFSRLFCVPAQYKTWLRRNTVYKGLVFLLRMCRVSDCTSIDKNKCGHDTNIVHTKKPISHKLTNTHLSLVIVICPVSASPTPISDLVVNVLKPVQYGIAGAPAVTLYRALFAHYISCRYHHTIQGREIGMWVHNNEYSIIECSCCFRLVLELVKKFPKFIPHTIDFVSAVQKHWPDRYNNFICWFFHESFSSSSSVPFLWIYSQNWPSISPSWVWQNWFQHFLFISSSLDMQRHTHRSILW